MRKRTLTNSSLASLLAVVLTAPVLAATPAEEIHYLLAAVGDSDCEFTRNGKQHSAAEAEAHLTMKFDRAGSRIKTAEAFIDRLASESSWSGKPYLIQCDGVSTPSRDWLTDRLEKFRTTT